jgi:hypothetical protein
MHYLEITGKGMEREPQYHKVDTNYCCEKLMLVTDNIRNRHLNANPCGEKK